MVRKECHVLPNSSQAVLHGWRKPSPSLQVFNQIEGDLSSFCTQVNFCHVYSRTSDVTWHPFETGKKAGHWILICTIMGAVARWPESSFVLSLSGLSLIGWDSVLFERDPLRPCHVNPWARGIPYVLVFCSALTICGSRSLTWLPACIQMLPPHQEVWKTTFMTMVSNSCWSHHIFLKYLPSPLWETRLLECQGQGFSSFSPSPPPPPSQWRD